MNDQTIPANLTRDQAQAVREWAERARGAEVQDGTVAHAARVLLAVLPPRPTLADMTDEERRACEWMQCEVEGQDGAWLIIDPFNGEDHAHLVGRRGNTRIFPAASITPRHDLPRMEWNGTDQDGEEVTKVDYVSVAGGRTAYGPWTVARLRKKADTTPALPDGWRLADHKEYGRGIVTNTTPNRDGRVYFVIPADDPMGYDWIFCTPDDLTYLEQGADQ